MAERLTYQNLVQQIVGVFWNLERGLIPTIRDLSLRPGKMLRGYLDGHERQRYIGVIPYIVLMASIASALFVFFPPPDQLFEPMRQGFAESGNGFNPDEFIEVYRDILNRYYQIFIYVTVPALALATRWVFRSWGYNYLEHLVINGFVAAHGTLISNILYPLLFIIPAQAVWLANIDSVLVAAFGIWVLVRLAGNYRFASWARALLAVFLGSGGVMILALILGVVVAVVMAMPITQARDLQISWDRDAADDAYRQAVAAFPVAALKMQYALFQAQTEREDAAMVLAREALDSDPDNAALRHQYGVVQLFAGDIQGARTSMESVLDLTEQTTVYVDLCRIEAGQGNYQKARQHGASFESVYENLNPVLLAVLAYCYRVGEAPDDAERVAALVDTSTDAEESNAITRAYARLAVGDEAAAIEQLELTIDEPVSLPIAANVMYIKLNVFNDPTFETPEFLRVRDLIGFRD